jgi:hypothetical protein
MKSATQHWPIALALGASVIMVRLYVILSGALQIDDAYITYRYAENIAAGLGFVYNSGEAVLGATTPLYTLLLALFAFVGAPVPTVSLVIGLLCSGLIAVTLFTFGKQLGFGAFAILPAALYAFWPNAINVDISGMESALFSLLVISFFYFVSSGKYTNAAFASGAATITRPEGLLCVALLFVFFLLIKRKQFLRELLIIAAIVLPWVIFATFYFDSPIPNSVSAKLALYLGYDTGTLFSRIGALFALQSAFGWLALVGAVWGLVYLLARSFWGYLEALYILFFALALGLSHTKIFYWYKAPLNPLLVLLISAGAWGAYQLLSLFFRSRRAVMALGIVLVVALIPALGAQLERVRQFQLTQSESYQLQHRRAGEYLATNAGAEQLLVAEDIGHLGYLYRGRVIDRDGLVSPEAIEFNRNLDYSGFLQKQLEEHPGHWLFIAMNAPSTVEILSSGILERGYTLDESFASFGSQDYLLYRSDSAANNTVEKK